MSQIWFERILRWRKKANDFYKDVMPGSMN